MMPITLSRVPCATGKREYSDAANFPWFSGNGSSTSSHTTSRRGRISALTARSPSLKMLFTMSCSASSKTPASVPCSIMTLISSSVTGGSSDGRNPRAPITRRVDPLINATTGAHKRDRKLMNPDIADPIRSGLCNASRLGSNSPITSDTYVIPTTTIPNAMLSRYGASCGTVSSRMDSRSVKVLSPNAPVKIAMSVMPI